MLVMMRGDNQSANSAASTITPRQSAEALPVALHLQFIADARRCISMGVRRLRRERRLRDTPHPIRRGGPGRPHAHFRAHGTRRRPLPGSEEASDLPI